MPAAGALSNMLGRKPLFVAIAILYAASAVWSALAGGYVSLFLARMIGGVAFGAALIIAPTYIAEISMAKNRGKLVSIQQLNIVLGFFAAFLSNWYLNGMSETGAGGITKDNVWRWMLGQVFRRFSICSPVSGATKSTLVIRGRTAEGHAVLQQCTGLKPAMESAAIRKARCSRRGCQTVIWNCSIRWDSC